MRKIPWWRTKRAAAATAGQEQRRHIEAAQLRHKTEGGAVERPEEHMQREPDRQIENDADHRRGHRGKSARQSRHVLQALDIGRARHDPQEARHESHPKSDDRRGHAAPKAAGETMARHVANEFGDQDQRPGRRLGEAETVDHLFRPEPAEILHRLLRHVAQDRIGAAEGDHRELREEQSDLRQRHGLGQSPGL